MDDLWIWQGCKLLAQFWDFSYISFLSQICPIIFLTVQFVLSSMWSNNPVYVIMILPHDYFKQKRLLVIIENIQFFCICTDPKDKMCDYYLLIQHKIK